MAQELRRGEVVPTDAAVGASKLAGIAMDAMD